MNLNGMRRGRIPNADSLWSVAKAAALGGLVLYATTHSLYNVEGGHRAIVFNRIEGIRDRVRPLIPIPIYLSIYLLFRPFIHLSFSDLLICRGF